MFDKFSDLLTKWIGSTASLIVHTILFASIFGLHIFGYSFSTVLLVLTTLLSIEAIYIAIFIQRAVNKQSKELDEAVLEIKKNTVENIEEPLDAVVDETRRISRALLRYIKQLKRVAEEEAREVKQIKVIEELSQEADELDKEEKRSIDSDE